MFLHRLGRLLGAVLLLAPSLALGQSALQQPNLVASPGVTVDPLPSAFTKLYQNDLFLQGLIASRFNTLGAAALLNVGTVTGTVADGGALTAEIARAEAAEGTNASAIATLAPLDSPAFTGAPTGPTPPQGDDSDRLATTAHVKLAVASGGVAAVIYSGSQALTPAQQATARGNIAAAASGANTDITSLAAPALGAAMAATATPGTATSQVANTAFVAASFAPLASPALTGTPTAPTAAAGTATSQVANTAFVANALGSYVAKAGDTMMGALTLSYANPSFVLKQTTTGTYNGAHWDLSHASDGKLYLNNFTAAGVGTSIGVFAPDGGVSVAGTFNAPAVAVAGRAVYGSSVGATSGGDQTDVAYNVEQIRLQYNWTASATNMIANATVSFTNASSNYANVICTLYLVDNVTGTALSSKQINPVTQPGLSGTGAVTIPLAAAGLIPGRSYNLRLNMYKNQNVGPITPGYMYINHANY